MKYQIVFKATGKPVQPFGEPNEDRVGLLVLMGNIEKLNPEWKDKLEVRPRP